MLVALEDKVIDTGTVVDTEKGKMYIHRKKVEDSHKGGYGKISAARVLEVSSNVGIVKLIQKHYKSHPQKFVDALEKLGLNSKLGLEIKGEGQPYIPSPKDNKTMERHFFGVDGMGLRRLIDTVANPYFLQCHRQ